MPLAFVLFVFFPRLAGSFWALPQFSQAVTGLSDTMSPGSISTLSESGDWPYAGWLDDTAGSIITSSSCGHLLGVGASRVDYRYSTGSGAFTVLRRQLEFPAAYAVVLTGMPPAWWVVRGWRRRRRRAAAGFAVQTESSPKVGRSAGDVR